MCLFPAFRVGLGRVPFSLRIQQSRGRQPLADSSHQLVPHSVPGIERRLHKLLRCATPDLCRWAVWSAVEWLCIL